MSDSKETPKQENEQKGKKSKSNNNNKSLVIVIIALIVVFLLLLGGLLYYFLVLKDKNAYRPVNAAGGKREAEALQGSLKIMTPEEIQEALDNIVEEGMFRISIASKIVAYEDGRATVNIENNLQNRYVMQVSIYLDGSNEEIYATDLIDPGYYIKDTVFSHGLRQGEYDAMAVFTAYYPDTEEAVGTAGAQVKIYVLPNDVTKPPQSTPAAE